MKNHFNLSIHTKVYFCHNWVAGTLRTGRREGTRVSGRPPVSQDNRFLATHGLRAHMPGERIVSFQNRICRGIRRIHVSTDRQTGSCPLQRALKDFLWRDTQKREETAMSKGFFRCTFILLSLLSVVPSSSCKYYIEWPLEIHTQHPAGVSFVRQKSLSALAHSDARRRNTSIEAHHMTSQSSPTPSRGRDGKIQY